MVKSLDIPTLNRNFAANKFSLVLQDMGLATMRMEQVINGEVRLVPSLLNGLRFDGVDARYATRN